jgi:type IV pilus assembly protein PilB
MKKRLGELLLESGLIDESHLAQALQAQQRTGEQLGRLLIRLGYLGENDLLRLLCEDAGVPFTALDEGALPEVAPAGIPESTARSHVALPLGEVDGRLNVALADPFDLATIGALERTTGRRISVVGAPRHRILAGIDRVYGGGTPRADAGTGFSTADADLAPPADVVDATAAQLADEILRRAVQLGATDVHIEPGAAEVRVRYRLDGILREARSVPRSSQSGLLTRIKVLAGLNIAESRLPQDGRLRIETMGREVDLRISTFPTLHGEDLVLRVLDRSRVQLQLSSLGLEPEDLSLFRSALRKPLGLILLTGPTGSGKTTTLYSALSELNTGERCILTLEDPIEYELEGVRQSQVNPRAGLTFATGLRSMLRHDPDVILVGEIRDADTAQIALSAAMTGHLVLSTLHTNSAASAIPRLLDMGVEPFTLASSFQLSVAQRLIRVLCPDCRQPLEVPAGVRRRFGLEDVPLYRAGGCGSCGRTGYRGRVAIFEFLPAGNGTAAAVHDRKAAEEIQRLSERPTLLQAGLAKVRAGVTTLEELFRVATL